MHSTKQISQALGQVAKSRVKKLGPPKLNDRQVAEKTFLDITKLISDPDRWTQTESRDVKVFRDQAGATWRLAVYNRNARLYLRLVRDGNGANLRWESLELEVGGLYERDDGQVRFGLATDFSHFSQWRRNVMRDRPVSRPSIKSS